MKRIYLGLILICTFVFVGCSEKIGDKFYPSENYVTRYQDPLSSYAAVYGSIDEYPVPSQSVVQFMINLRLLIDKPMRLNLRSWLKNLTTQNII